MNNLIIYLIGLIISSVPTGNNSGFDTDAIKNKIDSDIYSATSTVLVSNSGCINDKGSIDKFQLVMKDWETDAGTVATFTVAINEINYRIQSAKVILNSIDRVSLEMEMTKDQLWDSIAIYQPTIQITEINIDDNENLRIEGMIQVMMGFPVEIQFQGPIKVEDTVLKYENVNSVSVFNFSVGNWAGKYIKNVFDVLMDVNDWDLISAYIMDMDDDYSHYLENFIRTSEYTVDKGEDDFSLTIILNLSRDVNMK
ncbi:MAG TPA: hypothetical protein PLN69_03395 [bacterium]|nr:hypothetical protein [bacterium]